MQKMFKICRQRRRHFHVPSIRRMRKTDHHGVQCLPLQPVGLFPAAVHRVPQQRMPCGRQMNPDLVGSSGLQPAFDLSVFPKTLQHRIMGHRRFSVLLVDCHAFAIFRISADGRVDHPAVLQKDAVDDGPVPARDRMLF